MKAGRAAIPASPPLETLSLLLTASALERSRSMLWRSLPIKSPVVPASGASHTESSSRRRNGLVQIAFLSPGRVRKTFLKVIVVSSALFCGSGCPLFSDGAVATVPPKNVHPACTQVFSDEPEESEPAGHSWRPAAPAAIALPESTTPSKIVRKEL